MRHPGGKELFLYGSHQQFIAYEMGLQISRCFYPQETEKRALWEAPNQSRADHSRPRKTKGLRRSRRPHASRSCSYAHFNPSEAFSAQIVGYIKGKSALSILRMFLGRENGISPANTSGREDISCQRSYLKKTR